jgi:hypothetical protein
MTNEQINIAIAEACGWQFVTYKETFAKPPNGGPCQYKEGIPNYCKDLNAMHEAEKTLTKEQVRVYSDFLAYSPHESCWASCTIWHQTSRQRAEAFMKTIGKWEE